MRGYQQIGIEERETIELGIVSGDTVSKIALKTGRHRSTIYRELKRNKHCAHGYIARDAEHRTKQRKHCQKRRIESNKQLQDFIIECLKKRWSPEAIAGYMRVNKMDFYACHETIYQFLYSAAARTEKLYQYLTFKRYSRYYRGSRTPQESRIPAGLSVHDRGKLIDNRRRYGDWEGDLVMGKKNTGNVATLVERKSRMAIAIKNPTKHTAIVIDGIKQQFQTLPKSLCRSVTFDQGTEFASHQNLPCQTFFCDPHAPWQKGGNENFNGRLRRYLPKGSSFEHITQQHLDCIIENMNNTPRKCLNWKSPYDVFKDKLIQCRTST